MKIKRMINLIILILCLCLIAGVGTFYYNAVNAYKISNDFKSVPLQFNPDDASSVYQTQNAQITVNGGFVKGILKGKGWYRKPCYQSTITLAVHNGNQQNGYNSFANG